MRQDGIPDLSDTTWQSLHGSVDAGGEAVAEVLACFRAGKIAEHDVPRAIRFRRKKRHLDEIAFRRRTERLGDREVKCTSEPWHNLSDSEERAIVRECILNLRPPFSEASWLRWVEGLSVNAIALYLNCPPKTIYDRLSRAQLQVARALREKLNIERN